MILDEVHVSSESTSDVVDTLAESSTSIPNDIYIHEDDISDSEYALVKYSMSEQVARCSLVIPIIEDEIEYEIVATSVITSSKSLESPCAEYHIQTYFSHEKKSVHFMNLDLFHKEREIESIVITPTVSSFSE